jgi:hypothetical protein
LIFLGGLGEWIEGSHPDFESIAMEAGAAVAVHDNIMAFIEKK